MKVETKTKGRQFETIEITIKIESLNELMQLAKRLNVAVCSINRNDDRYPDIVDKKTTPFWEELDSLYFKLAE